MSKEGGPVSLAVSQVARAEVSKVALLEIVYVALLALQDTRILTAVGAAKIEV